MLACTSSSTRAAEGWAQLKLGMTAAETVALLGAPLIRTSGNGFELWTYDKGAEVLLFGSLIGWTMAGAGDVAGRSFDIWRAKRGGVVSASFWDTLPRAQPAPMGRPHATPEPPASEREWLPRYVRRHS